jgi:hypothetical protein
MLNTCFKICFIYVLYMFNNNYDKVIINQVNIRVINEVIIIII